MEKPGEGREVPWIQGFAQNSPAQVTPLRGMWRSTRNGRKQPFCKGQRVNISNFKLHAISSEIIFYDNRAKAATDVGNE